MSSDADKTTMSEAEAAMRAALPYPVPGYAPVARLLELLHLVSQSKQVSELEASLAIVGWTESLASPEQIAMVETSDELEVDDVGAGVSEGADGDGFFIQTWTWVSTQS